MECKTSFNADPNKYSSVSKKNEPLDILTKLTFPTYEKALQERLEIEARLIAEPLSFSPQDRHALIRNSLLLLSPKVEKRFASTHIDKEVRLSLVAAVALVTFGLPAVGSLRLFPDSEGTVLLVFLGACIALVAWQGLQSGRRFMRREVLPVLAKTLQPLQASDSEFEAVLAELKQLGHKIGNKVVLADLRALLAPNAN
jgi:hypothetical protein